MERPKFTIQNCYTHCVPTERPKFCSIISYIFYNKSAKSAKSARIKIQRSLRKNFATLRETTPKATK